MVNPAVNTPHENIQVFDLEARARCRQRAAPDFENYSFLQTWAQDQLSERLQDIKRTFQSTHELTPCDFSGKLEALGFTDESLELITSNLNLHAINDLPGVLLQIRKALQADGLFIGALFGGETLYELRESLMQAEIELKGGVSPRVFPFADKQQIGGLLQRAGFALPVVDSEIITVTYDNMFKLMHDLRGMGESNVIAARSRTNPGKAFFMNAAQRYLENHAEKDGRIKASFEIIFLLGWAPHDSQQKPLKPGSAQSRLADALNTDEIKTGEKPAP